MIIMFVSVEKKCWGNMGSSLIAATKNMDPTPTQT